MKKSIFAVAMSLPTYCLAQQIIPAVATPLIHPTSRNYAALNTGADSPKEHHATSVSLFGVGGLDDLTKLNENGGSAAVGASISFGKAKFDEKGGVINGTDRIINQIYLAYNAKAANTPDTTALAKTLLFPDISKRDFTIGYLHNFNSINTNLSLSFYGEMSTSRNIFSRNDSTFQFRSFSGSIGAKFNFISSIPIGSEDKLFAVSIIPYYNAITVDPKEFKTYNDAFDEKYLPPTFHTLGVKGLMTLTAFTIFANYKYVLNDVKELSSPDLKGGNVVVGAVIDANILRFTYPSRLREKEITQSEKGQSKDQKKSDVITPTESR